MKKYLSRLFIFLLIPAVIVSVISVAVPATPRSTKSLLFSKLDKDILLENTPSPRLILIGGSNLTFGIDSSLFKQALGLNPINTAIQASIGLTYMLKNTIEYVRPGDIVIISPEYSQFYARYAFGEEELLRTVLDVDRQSLKTLNLNQWLNILEYLPRYAISKIKPSEYNFKENPFIGIYERKSFNEYGDVNIHWNHESIDFKTKDPIEGKFNDQVIKELLLFENQVLEKDAMLFITFPCLEEHTYQVFEENIIQVEEELIKNGFQILGTPPRYRVPKDLSYNTPYHLNREGAMYRTTLLIEDLRSAGIPLED
ncbi:MAG: hypothetical protein WBB69_15570 [Anaerolineales bacterium]